MHPMKHSLVTIILKLPQIYYGPTTKINCDVCSRTMVIQIAIAKNMVATLSL